MTCDEKRVSDQYPELFHYTQVPTFEKIYKSRELWATHYENLNDSSELNQFRLKVAEYIAPHVRRNLDKRIQSDAQTVERVRRHGGIDALVKLEAEHWADIFHKKTFSDRWIKDTFICSFCTPDRDRKHLSTHGLLSQWRGYGKDRSEERRVGKECA